MYELLITALCVPVAIAIGGTLGLKFYKAHRRQQWADLAQFGWKQYDR